MRGLWLPEMKEERHLAHKTVHDMAHSNLYDIIKIIRMFLLLIPNLLGCCEKCIFSYSYFYPYSLLSD